MNIPYDIYLQLKPIALSIIHIIGIPPMPYYTETNMVGNIIQVLYQNFYIHNSPFYIHNF